MYELLFQKRRRHGVRRRGSLFVLYKVAQVAVLFLADRRFERNGVLRNLLNFHHSLLGYAHFLGDLFGSGFSAEFLHKLALNAQNFVYRFYHMHGYSYSAGLIGYGAGYRLTNPPGSVGREFETLLIVEFFNRFHKSQIAFLNKVEKLHSPAHVPLGYGHHEP